MTAAIGRREHEAPGMEAFSILRAEDEPWLHRCFVPPKDFESIVAPRSVVVFGAPGSGKTALYQELRARSRQVDGKPTRLLVDWRPEPLPGDVPPGLPWVKRQTEHVFDVCATALMHHLGCYPEDYAEAPEWAQARVDWFIHRFIRGDLALQVGPLTAGESAGASLLHRVLDSTPKQVLYEDAPPDRAAAELGAAVRGMGLDGVWVMSDGLGDWVRIDSDRVSRTLKAFLSTLSLFENSNLTYKLWVPSRLESALSHAGGLGRRRLDSVHIQWTAAKLRRVVERRLALVLDHDGFKLEQLCNADGFLDWLETVGGTSPRAWLDQVYPLVEHCLARPRSCPVGEAAWNRLQHQHPPRLYLDDAAHRVFVGGREVGLENLPAKAYDMLRYLCRRGGEVVTKAELYYLAYRGLDYVPRSPADEGFEGRKEYEGVVDTNLWRLRKAIEPDPSDPVLLITRRGHGVELRVRW